MSKQHNKKRNIGIIYEQLLLSLAEAIVEKNNEKVSTIKDIISRNFKPGSELYKEFRLFNALIKTSINSESLATRILEEAKKASRNFDRNKLEIEKSHLIKDINYKINDTSFYTQRINEYKSYATIQTLLNDWRSDNSNLERVVEYESKVHNILLTEKIQSQEKPTPEIDRLTVKIMREKFNKKYKSFLNEEQINIIKSYIFHEEDISKKLSSIKENSIKELSLYKNRCTNDILLEKIDRIIENVKNLNESTINDDNVSKFLLLSKLKNEIKDESEK